MKKYPFFYFLFFVFFLVFLDQLLKIWVFKNQFNLFGGDWWWDNLSFFKITYLENSGMAFGFLNNSGWVVKLFLTLFRIIAVFIMFFYVFFEHKKKPVIFLFVFAMLVSGAVGNCIDSVFYDFLNLNNNAGGFLFHGKVIDMFSFSFFPPVFNLADSYITIGCVLVLIFYKKLSSISV